MRTKKSVACYGRRDEEKDEQWRVQQEILARRRNKDKQRAYFESIDKKRSDLKKNFDAKRIKYRKGEDPLGQWKEINKGKTYKDEYSDEPGYSIKIDCRFFSVEAELHWSPHRRNLPIPIASFGLPKFDNGERFDLRLPYVDQGYVAEDSDDAWGRFLGIFGGKKDGEKKASSTAAAKSSGKKTTAVRGNRRNPGAKKSAVEKVEEPEPFNPFGRGKARKGADIMDVQVVRFQQNCRAWKFGQRRTLRGIFHDNSFEAGFWQSDPSKLISMTSKASTPEPLQADGERVDAKKKDLGREDAPKGKNPSSIEDDTTASWDPYEYMPISLLTLRTQYLMCSGCAGESPRYFWVTPLIEKGYRRPLMQEDLPAVLEEDKAETLHRNLRLAWEREKALLASFNWGHTIFLVVSGGAKICAGIVLGLIIDFFSDANENGNANWGRGCLYALAMVGCIGVGAAGQHIYFFFGWRKGMNARIAATTIVYTQILNMRACVTAGKSTGHIVNLTSTDAERFSLATMFWPYLIFAPLEACVVLVILWYELGYGAIAGYAITLVSDKSTYMKTPGCDFGAKISAGLREGADPSWRRMHMSICVFCQFRFSKAYARLRFEAAHYTDQRVKLMSEVITGVRVMKCYAWEHAIADRVGRVRELESIAIKKTASLRGLNEGLYFSCPAIVG
eukprot:jgi/Bigna1/90850/estExt_fgenesh1_pg.C_810031